MKTIEEEMKTQKVKDELHNYQVMMCDLTDCCNDLIRYKNIKEGLQAAQMDGMPRAYGKTNERLEEAITTVDEKIDWLSNNSKNYLKECDRVEQKINSIEYPGRTVLQMKYKEHKKDWEIAEVLGKSKKQVRRYIDDALIIYEKL